MPDELRALPLELLSHCGSPMRPNDDDDDGDDDNGDNVVGQYAPRSRPVSFYDNFKIVPMMPPCVTSAMSVGNLSNVRDGSSTSPFVPQSNNNNNNNNCSNIENSNRVSSAVSAGNVSRIQGPKVTGAVSTGNIGKIVKNEKDKELDRAPSMANCLSTTVPVNLAASQIAGRHTPTRNSLRHSRMIVLHRTGHRPRKSLPPLLHHHRLARCLAALQTILGIAVTSLSLWLLLWAPNLPVIDNPYWSGMPLLLSGSFGICLLCCFKKEYPGMSPGFCLSSTKVVSAFLSMLATGTCLIACIAAGMHLARLTGLECSPARVLNATCVCKPRNEQTSPLVGTIKYLDLNCPEVENVLTILLIFSTASNGFGTMIAGCYGYLHWSTRQTRANYTPVRTTTIAPTTAAVPSGNSRLGRRIYNPNPNGR